MSLFVCNYGHETVQLYSRAKYEQNVLDSYNLPKVVIFLQNLRIMNHQDRLYISSITFAHFSNSLAMTKSQKNMSNYPLYHVTSEYILEMNGNVMWKVQFRPCILVYSLLTS